MYIEREIESTVDAMLRQGKVVLVTGVSLSFCPKFVPEI